MSKVFFSVGLSLDGFIAGENRGPDNPMGDRGTSIHEWIFEQRVFRENLGLGAGGETGADNQYLEALLARTGASIMGKRMFEEGERSWPENAPFHTPVFVLTSERRSPWQRPGGTTFYFVNDGPESALEQARAAVGGKDIRIAGGATIIRRYLETGLVDEFKLSLSPRWLGRGLRLFEHVDLPAFELTIADVLASPRVTHLEYRVRSPSEPGAR
jgi:dihydrofolate reductase